MKTLLDRLDSDRNLDMAMAITVGAAIFFLIVMLFIFLLN
jgi:hypothetical protein